MITAAESAIAGNGRRRVGQFDLEAEKVGILGEARAAAGCARVRRSLEGIHQRHHQTVTGETGFAADSIMMATATISRRALSRLRIMTALMAGRLQRSRLYHELHVPEFSFTSVDGPTAVALDGEVNGQCEQASLHAHYRALRVFCRLPQR